MLGEARSKCEHLVGIPLKPEFAQKLYNITLIKGAVATTAIEGNTLTEEQVQGIIEGTFSIPDSRRHQEQEVLNVVGALNDIQEMIVSGKDIVISEDLILEFNRQILRNLELDSEIPSGKYRYHSVVVGGYMGDPAEDCRFLTNKLVEWLNSDIFKNENPEINFALTIAKAIFAHLYLAWIHPFGDGNGRTARLVEFLILASSGFVPLPAAHLLSNYYNLTRDRYYRELSKVSKNGGKAVEFIVYAAEGFADGIREVIKLIREQQLEIAWVNYVYERFESRPNTNANDRMLRLILELPIGDRVAKKDITGLTPQLAQLYSKVGPRTLARDLNQLSNIGLLSIESGKCSARSDIMLAFLPIVANKR